ncbi:hypothetical protein [Streptomyces adonidis]|uniref:Uncharacterized protein n=1 Tax=Streptomyces sp. NBC_00093 TaxID=2975649 RepID=A0AAU1ZP37_9ACTN
MSWTPARLRLLLALVIADLLLMVGVSRTGTDATQPISGGACLTVRAAAR